MGNFF